MRTRFFFAAAATLLLAGCSQNEITEMSPDARPAVGFDVYTGVQTKGTVTDDAVTGTGIKAKGFGIHAYYTGQDIWTTKMGNLAPNFMWNQKVEWKNNVWSYDPVKYWPNTDGDKISFFAYAPYSATQTAGNESYGIALSNNTAIAKPTLTFKLQDNPTAMVDLVTAFQKDVQKKTTAVDFTFGHILARANFKAKLDRTLTGSPTYIFVTNMRILGKNSEGTGGDISGANNSSKFYEKATYDWSAGTWDYTAPTAATAAYDISGTGGILNKVTQTSTIASGYTTQGVLVAQAGTETALFNANEYLFLIPPADITGISAATDVRVQIDYDIVTKDINVSGGFTRTSTSATVSLPNGTLKRGSAYDFIFTIGLESVQVSASVTAWATATNTPLPSVDAATADATGITNAITVLNTAKGQDKNCNYFIVNVNTAFSGGSLSLSPTLTNFVSGDQIELNFKAASTVSSVSMTGWKNSTTLNGAIGKIILTKN